MPIFTQWLKEQAMPGRLREIDKGEYTPPPSAPPQPPGLPVSQPTPRVSAGAVPQIPAETPKLQNGQLLPYKPTTFQRIKDALRKFNQKAGETAEFVGQAGAGPLTDIASAAFRPRGNDLQGLSPEAQQRIQKEWAPESFRRAPETAKYISPATAEIASAAGSVYPYIIAGPFAEMLGAGATTAALGKVAPKFAATAIGQALPHMAGQGTTFGGLTAIEEAIRGLSEPEKFNLAQSVKRVLSSTGEGALFGAGQEFIGAPLKNVAAKALPILSKPGVSAAAARGATGAVAGAAAMAPLAGMHYAQNRDLPSALGELAFGATMEGVPAALGGPASYAARVRTINEAKGYVPKAEPRPVTPADEALALDEARRKLDKMAVAEKPVETPVSVSEKAAEAVQSVPEAPVAPQGVEWTRRLKTGDRVFLPSENRVVIVADNASPNIMRVNDGYGNVTSVPRADFAPLDRTQGEWTKSLKPGEQVHVRGTFGTHEVIDAASKQNFVTVKSPDGKQFFISRASLRPADWAATIQPGAVVQSRSGAKLTVLDASRRGFVTVEDETGKRFIIIRSAVTEGPERAATGTPSVSPEAAQAVPEVLPVAEPSPVTAETTSPVTVSPAAKEPWQMTRQEFDAYWVSKSKAGLEAEVARNTSKLEVEKARLADALAADPENPANARVRERIQAIDQEIAAQNSRLSQPILAPSTFMSEAQLRWHQGIDQALKEGKPVPPEVLADYPDLQTSAQATAPAEAPATVPIPAATAHAPEAPTANAGIVSKFAVGDTVRIKGRPDIYTVTNTSDPSLLGLRSQYGAELKAGRSTVEPAGTDNTATQTTASATEAAATAEAPVTTPESAVTSDIQQQLLARVSAAEGNVAERGSVMLPGRRSKTAESIMTLSDPEAERRFQQSKALPEKTLKEHAIEIKQDIQKALSKYDIPRNDPYFADVHRKLTEMESKMDFISDEVVREYSGLLMNLEGDKAAKNDLLGKALAILDSMEDLEAGKGVFPFGWTKESLPIDKAKLDETLLRHPDVAKAVEERRALYKAATDENIAANKAIGRDNTDLFHRGNYFRHMVIERLQGIKPKETGKRLKTPSGRSYMKERKGSELDIYTNHIDVDILTLAQIKYDTEVAKFIGLVKSPKYNIYDSLRAEARKQNDALIRKHFEAMAEETGGDAESLYKQTLNMRQAIGADKLQKLAKAGELPDDGRWEYLIQDIKDGSAEMPEMMPYMAWVLKAKPESEAAVAAATVFKGMRLKSNYIRDKLGDRFVTPQDIISEGWEPWQPEPGNMFFSAYTISDKLAEKMLNGVLPEVAQKDVHRILAIGGKKPFFVIRSELASTLNNLKDTRANSTIAKLARFLQGQWKQYALTGPKSFVSYNVHNTGSDLDVMMFAPKVMLKTPQAAEDLMALTMGKAGPKGELKEWLRRGGEASTMSVQEAGAVNELKLFHEYVAKRKNWTPRQLWDGWFKAARKATSTREALLRYSAYLHYLDEIQKSPTSLPKKFGASIPSEIRGLTDPRDKAFVLANDLLGAYNEVSRTGKWVRENMLFFWSFQEINLRRYWQLVKNEVNTEASAKAMAEGYVKGIAKVAPSVAFRLGTFLLKASAWWVALQTYNNMVHPDLEEELPADVRPRPHIVLGRGPDGKVIYYDRLSANQDVLEWFGVDDLPQDYRDVLDGKKGLKNFAVDALKSSVNKVIQGMGPHVKTPLEGVFRRKLYPDAFNGTPIRDIGEWLASQARLNEEYARLKGLPVKPFNWRADPARLALGFRTSDPGESAYFDALDLKSKYLESIGKHSSFGGTTSEKSLALYNMRKAARLGDKEAYRRYLLAYVKAGGTLQGMNTSFRNLDPLAGLNAQEKKGFIDWLNPGDKARLLKANQFYQQMLQNTTEFLR